MHEKKKLGNIRKEFLGRIWIYLIDYRISDDKNYALFISCFVQVLYEIRSRLYSDRETRNCWLCGFKILQNLRTPNKSKTIKHVNLRM